MDAWVASGRDYDVLWGKLNGYVFKGLTGRGLCDKVVKNMHEAIVECGVKQPVYQWICKKAKSFRSYRGSILYER